MRKDPQHAAFHARMALAIAARRNTSCTPDVVRRLTVALVLATVACGPHLPLPPRETPPPDAFVDVPSPPPPPHVERVPPRPPGAVWVDGSWERLGTRWRWRDGGWFQRPGADIVRTDWALRREGERLLFAAAAWRDRRGVAVAGPPLLASGSMDGHAAEDQGESTDAGR